MAKKRATKDTRKFHLGDILSITTGVCCAPNAIDGIYDILDFMTSDSLYTSQLPRGCDECKPYLIEQLPQLAVITEDDVVGVNNAEKIDKLVAKYGAFHVVRKIHPEDHQIIDVQIELAMTHPHIEVIDFGVIDESEDDHEA